MFEFFSPIFDYFCLIKKSLLPRKIPNNFWKLNIYDIICFFIVFLPVIIIWEITAFRSSIRDILEYWDGPNYIYAAISLYTIPEDYPWNVYFKYKPSYFACHLPGYPLMIRFCTFFTLGNYEIGAFLSIIFCNFLLVYSFRRLLLAYRCSYNSIFLTCLLSILPFRLVIYRSVVASEPLFLTFVCMAMIFYKFDMKSRMIFFVWCCCITRIEGMSVGFVFGVCYLIRFDIKSALMMFTTFVPYVFLVIMHDFAFNEPLAYLHFNSGQQGIMKLIPFYDLITPVFWKNRGLLPNSFFMYFVAMIGIISIFPIAFPIGLFSTVFYLYGSMLFHLDTQRYLIPCHIFAYLIGFDSFFTRAPTPAVCCLVYPIAVAMLSYYCASQIQSNKCDDIFMDHVINSAKKVI